MRSGHTADWSNVPSSRSRATDWPVTDSTDSAAIVTIRAGIVNQRYSRFGPGHDACGGRSRARRDFGADIGDDLAEVTVDDLGGVGPSAVEHPLDLRGPDARPDRAKN